MILVTGASEGIGRACAEALLARTRTSVLITGRNAEKLHDAQQAVGRSQRDRLRTHVCDQGDARAVTGLCTLLAGLDEPVEGAILGVGANPLYCQGAHRLHALDPETIDATIRTNCTHAVRITGALLERFRHQRAGVLIWIGSQAARHGMPGAALYGATKSFLSGLAVAAHREYAGRGVRVHLLHPGVVRTPRTIAVADGFAAKHGWPVAEPQDVAARIVDVFLAGDPAQIESDL